eukprot:3702572-Rhodomonas_salina.4
MIIPMMKLDNPSDFASSSACKPYNRRQHRRPHTICVGPAAGPYLDQHPLPQLPPSPFPLLHLLPVAS